MVFINDRQRKAAMANMNGKTVTFRVPAKRIPSHSEPVDVHRLTFAKMRDLSNKAGLHWFSRDTMSFFNTHLHGKPYVSAQSRVYFVTSETFREDDPDFPRKYTIRQFDPARGSVETVGAFNKYKTYDEARKSMEEIDW